MTFARINNSAADSPVSLKSTTDYIIVWHPMHNKLSRSKGQRSRSRR